MIRSMTGFGKAELELAGRKVTIEIRSLNSRQMDIITKIPSVYRDREPALRNEIASRLKRGKADLVIQIETTGSGGAHSINAGAVKHYAEQLGIIASDIGVDRYDRLEILKLAMRMPDTVSIEKSEADEKEWDSVFERFLDAIDQLDRYRIQEGEAMKADIGDRIRKIKEYLASVDQFEEPRIDTIRKRLQQNLREIIPANSLDLNRFEQEIVFYLEKLDITEEKVRLSNHIAYFMETLQSAEPPGKKLGFITQEMGREINTIGSKANDFNIQKLVVQMKDELEKIKEQSLNLL
jgi:uncharacterized protein (TIGR00255 family)